MRRRKRDGEFGPPSGVEPASGTGQKTLNEALRAELTALLNSLSSDCALPMSLIFATDKQDSIDGQNMNPYCAQLWRLSGQRELCARDHQQNAETADNRPATVPCRAGCLNSVIAVDLGPAGRAALVAGQRLGVDASSPLSEAAQANYTRTIEELAQSQSRQQLEDLKSAYEAAAYSSRSCALQVERDAQILPAIAAMMKLYVEVREREISRTGKFERGLARLFHEVGDTAVYIELNAYGMIEQLNGVSEIPRTNGDLLRYARSIHAMAMEARFECQNLLANAPTGHEYDRESTVWQYKDVLELLTTWTPTLEMLASERDRQLLVEAHGGRDIREVRFPKIKVMEPVLQRAIFNVFTNALKYSYHPSRAAGRDRYVRIVANPRYSSNGDMFAICFENYGIGFADRQEILRATEFGFRGSLASKERPIGSGIGLSEVDRIMRAHHGFVRIRSAPIGRSPALTQVWLVFRKIATPRER